METNEENWEAKPETDHRPASVWVDGKHAADIFGETREIRAARARLMASAPDLLEACMIALDLAREYGDTCAKGRGIDLREVLAEAISKAKE